MRRRVMFDGGGIGPSQAAPLNVVFWTGNKLVIREEKNWKNGETPIGIVVVPGYHDRYGDGSCGIMSLVGMDNSNPNTGAVPAGSGQSDSITVMYGHRGSSIGNSIFSSTTALTSSANYIPYQTNSASTACTGNTNALIWPYAGTVDSPTTAASTSYTNTGGYVPAITGKSGCDFNGIRNTVAAYVKTRTSAQWTASTVTNNSGTTYTPAAACCGRFKTVGTKSFLDIYSGTTSNNTNYGTSASAKENKGFWYLPAEGELSYLARYRHEINRVIRSLIEKYGNIGFQIATNYYWSSSENSATNAWRITLSNGYLSNALKSNTARVRAFMRL